MQILVSISVHSPLMLHYWYNLLYSSHTHGTHLQDRKWRILHWANSSHYRLKHLGVKPCFILFNYVFVFITIFIYFLCSHKRRKASSGNGRIFPMDNRNTHTDIHIHTRLPMLSIRWEMRAVWKLSALDCAMWVFSHCLSRRGCSCCVAGEGWALRLMKSTILVHTKNNPYSFNLFNTMNFKSLGLCASMCAKPVWFPLNTSPNGYRHFVS